MNERGFGQNVSPVKEGEELDVEIEAVGEKGDGIAKKEGFVLFIPNAKQGDKVKVRVTRVLRNVGFADVIGKSEGNSGSESTGTPAGEVSPEPVEDQAESEESSDIEDSEDFGEEESSETQDSEEEKQE
ncbi:TRAM domain-containing protein [Candidatus Woesearchaeota archaeon]|nr:TRAM domain-containing protein [Candidatus Woesearchaeota archaeon]